MPLPLLSELGAFWVIVTPPLIPMTMALGSNVTYPAPSPLGDDADPGAIEFELIAKVRALFDKLIPAGFVKVATPLSKL